MASSIQSPTQTVEDDSAALQTSPQSLPSHLFSELPIQGTNLIFGLNFKYTEVIKKGLINRLKKNTHTLDLDLSCVLFNDQLQISDTVWFKQLRDASEAIRHQGDSLNGKDRGASAELDRNVDVETIELRLERLPQQVAHIALIVSSYQGYPIRKVERGNLYISDDEGNELYTVDLTLLDNDSPTLCVAVLSRELGEWRYTQNELFLENYKMSEVSQQIQNELSRIYG